MTHQAADYLRSRPLLYATLLNLAIGVAMRLLVPSDFTSRGERYLYVQMANQFPIAGCESFHCFRIVPPLLTNLIPSSFQNAFSITGFIFLVLTGTMSYQLIRALGGSDRRAVLVIAIFWTTWGAIASLYDVLLIPDPVALFLLITALYLLITSRYRLALVVLIVGALSKEVVLLAPLIYLQYLVLSRDRVRGRVAPIAACLVLPAGVWAAERLWLRSAFGYGLSATTDLDLLRQTYFFGTWLPNVGWRQALINIFAAFGAVWFFAVLGFSRLDRRERAFTIACIMPMLLLALYQTPDRALGTFAVGIGLAASAYLVSLPLLLTTLLLIVNAVFTMRIAATTPWLPSIVVLLSALGVLVVGALYYTRQDLFRWTRQASEPPTAGSGRPPCA
jgi:hypothetical protein